MKRIVDYSIVFTEKDNPVLQGANTRLSVMLVHSERIRKYLKRGWQPFGSVQVHNAGTPSEYVLQVMVKYADDEQDD